MDSKYRLHGRVPEILRPAYLTALLGVAACSADRSNELHGAAGGPGHANGFGGAVESGEHAPVNASDVIHDPRWDPPEGIDQIIAPPSNATACTLNSQCVSGYCVDGFCCDNKCDNKCMACSAAKKGSGVDGVCGSIKYDTDPDNDCPTGACDGKNQCKNYNGVSCTSNAGCLSNYCVDGFCCNNICMGSCQACSATKKGSGSNGVCGNIVANADPDNECTGSQCNGSGACQTAQSTSPNGTACSSSAQCASGYCADGVCCDSWCLGTCQACSAAKKGSGADGTCGNIANDKDPDDECWGGACNGTAVCKQYNGVPCTTASQCLSNYCVDGFCCGNICTSMCQACSEAKKGQGYDGVCGPIASGKDPENECNPGECNGSGTCNQTQTPQANGTTCVSGGQCASGNCVDGYCCDTTCTETCKACSAAKKGSGANGVCGNVASETNPDGECNGGRCDGTGACRYYNGAPCTATNQCFSNLCVDGFCCGNACTSTCYACSASKKGSGFDGVCGPIGNTKDPDNECNPGECNGSGACNMPQTPEPNGTSCTFAIQCLSGFCVDGVCCESACTGSCQACSAAKKGSGTSGTCGNIKYDTDPDEECWGGACSGSGACKYYNGVACTQTSECLSNYCVDGYCCNNLCGGPCRFCNAAQAPGVCTTQCPAPCPGNVGLPNPSFSSSGVPLTASPRLLGSADLNGDGMLDFYTRDASTTIFSVLLGQANGVFAAPVDYSVTGVVQWPPQDLNGDGKVDVLSLDVANDSFGVRLNQGNGTFATQVNYATGDNPFMITSDVDGDSLLDVVTKNTGTTMGVIKNLGNGTFAAPVDYTLGTTQWLSLVDLNGDAKPDAVTVDRLADRICVLLNQGNGTFGPRVDYVTSDDPQSFTMLDVSGDGIADVVTGHAPVKMTVMVSPGNGTLGPFVEYTAAGIYGTWKTADLNGDGNVEIIGRINGSSAFSVHYNQGNGVFGTKADYSMGSQISTLDTRDLNGDGKLDVFVGYEAGSSASVLLNQGNGSLGAKIDTSIAFPTNEPTLADIDGDGKADLIAGGGNGMSVMLNQSNGSFQLSDSYSVPDTTYAISVADLAGDTKPDLAVAFGTLFAVRTNLGNGVFTKVAPNNPAVYPVPTAPISVLAGDFDNDGQRDVASRDRNNVVTVSNGQGNGVLGPAAQVPSANWSTYASIAADTNRNGYIELNEQALELFRIWADFSGDGRIDYAYYRMEMGNWGPGGSEYKPERHYMDIYSGNADGTFTLLATYFLNEFSPWGPFNAGMPAFAAADFNGDGKLDIGCSAYNHARVMLNTGGGAFDWATMTTWSVSGTLPTSIYAGDFNQDAKADVIVGWYSGILSVYLGQGNGTFAAQPINTAANGYKMRVGDLTNDGKLDLLLQGGSNYLSDSVVLMRGNGDGTFGPQAKYGVGSNAMFDKFISDMDNDDRLDVITANDSSHTISVLLNRCQP